MKKFILYCCAAAAAVVIAGCSSTKPGTASSPEKPAPIVETLTARAEKGDAYAQGLLSGIYFRGDLGVKRNFKTGIKWAKLSAEKKNPLGLFRMGWIYQYGLLGHVDMAKANKYYKESIPGLLKLAQSGNSEAQLNLSTVYYELGKNAEAKEWLNKSAENNNYLAQAILGMAYLNGKVGYKKNPKLGLQWLEKSATQGYRNAQAQLVNIYTKGAPDIKPDKKLAEKWRAKFMNNVNY